MAYTETWQQMLVALELGRGNRDAALVLLQSHVQDAEASQAQIQRMGELIVALGSKPELETESGSDGQD